MYMTCWAVVGLATGVFSLMIHDYTLSGKDTDTYILVSTLFFAILGLILPWNIVKNITRVAGAAAGNTPFLFMLVLLVLVIVFFYVYKLFLIYLAGIWLEYYPQL
jgi:hypothetical protein